MDQGDGMEMAGYMLELVRGQVGREGKGVQQGRVGQGGDGGIWIR